MEEKKNQSIPMIIQSIVICMVALAIAGFGYRSCTFVPEQKQNIRSLLVKRVQKISPDVIDPTNEGKAVYMVGEATGQGTLNDELFGLSVTDKLALKRQVEMYQWLQKKRFVHRSGKRRVEYSYNKVWKAHRIDSTKFNEKEYVNPKFDKISPAQWLLDEVKVGKFKLAPFQVKNLKNWSSLSILQAKKIPAGGRRSNQYIHFSAKEGEETIGDLRVSFKVLAPTTVTILGRQKKEHILNYNFAKENISDIKKGKVSLHSILKVPTEEEAANKDSAASDTSKFVGAIALFFGFILLLVGIRQIKKEIA